VTAARVGDALGAAILLATLLNGLGPFLRRVGLADREAYERYWVQRCGNDGTRAAWLGLGRRCTVPEDRDPRRPELRRFTAHVLATKPAEYPLKAAKDVFLAGAFALALVQRNRSRQWSWAWREVWPLWGLAGVILLRAAFDVSAGDWVFLLSGLRSLAFVALSLALAGSRISLSRLATWCAALALLELCLVPWEHLYGLTDRPISWLWTRAAGTLVHPNALGLLAVATVGLVSSVDTSRGLTILTWSVGICLTAFAASGAGLLLLVAIVLLQLAPRIPVSLATKAVTFGMVILLFVAALPVITDRPDLPLSVTEGRVTRFLEVVDTGPVALVVGRGLGVGTNTLMSAFGQAGQPLDSTLTLVVGQVGLLGAGLLYVAFFLAWRRSPRLRPLTVTLAVASLVANIAETFPVNLLLALGLRAALTEDGEILEDSGRGVT
jgi:hypothetical protein